MCILCLRNDLQMCHAILDSTYRYKTTTQLRPLALVPRVVVFVRYYCILLETGSTATLMMASLFNVVCKHTRGGGNGEGGGVSGDL